MKMKKRGKIQKLTSFLVVFVMLLGAILQSQPAFAEGLERLDTKITEFTVTTSSGEIPPDGFKLHSLLRLKISWDASRYENNLKAGDFFNVTLPKEFRFPTNSSACNFDILTSDGTAVVAKAVVTPGAGNEGGGNIKVTFTEYVENKYNIKGSMYLNANFNRTIINTPGEHQISIAIGSFLYSTTINIIPSTPQNEVTNELLNKWTGQTLDADGHVRWVLRINHKKANLTNVVLSEQLTAENGNMDGVQYVENSFFLEEVEMDNYGNQVGPVISRVDISRQVQLSGDKTSFTYNMGNIGGKQYYLRYNTTYKSGLKLRNEAKLDGDGISVIKKSSFSVEESGGQGSGDLFGRIKIIKVDKDNDEIKLANAKFLITKLADNSTFELTTGANGETLSDKLAPGKYKIKEISVPIGYVFGNETEYEVTVTPDETCIQTIKNEAVKTNITVKKQWVGAIGRPVMAILKADGTEVANHELTEATSWTYTFENLRKYQPGTDTEIVYTADEGTAPQGYKVSYEKTADGKLIIKNTQITEVKVTKEWVTATGTPLTGHHPTIMLQLLKNGQEEGSPIELTNGTTAYTWTELDKTDAVGNEYTYTVKEVGETGNSIKLDGDWYHVIYGGNQQLGITVTNKKFNPWTPWTPGTPPVSQTGEVKVTKLWKDHSGNAIAAPIDKITVELYKDGNPTGKTLELNAGNGWTGVFKNLEVSNGTGGTAYYKYTVKEIGEQDSAVKFEGKLYKVFYGGNLKDGFTITNEKESPIIPSKPNNPTPTPKSNENQKVPNSDTPNTVPKTGAEANLSLYVWLMLISGNLLVLLGIGHRKHAK